MCAGRERERAPEDSHSANLVLTEFSVRVSVGCRFESIIISGVCVPLSFANEFRVCVWERMEFMCAICVVVTRPPYYIALLLGRTYLRDECHLFNVLLLLLLGTA